MEDELDIIFDAMSREEDYGEKKKLFELNDYLTGLKYIETMRERLIEYIKEYKWFRDEEKEKLLARMVDNSTRER